MRNYIIAVAFASTAFAANAQVRVDGYVKKDGTYVAPHTRSAPNSSVYDNYSTKPNVNPYTGKSGTNDPYSTNSQRSYGKPYGSTKPKRW